VKQTLRNSLVFGTLGLACFAAAQGCSSPDAATPIGFGMGGTGVPATGGASAGSPTTIPVAGMSGSGTVTPIGGTGFGTGGTFVTPTAGMDAGGAAAGSTTGGAGGTGGSGGTGTAGGAGGTGGTAAGGTDTGMDFPTACPMPSATAHSANKLTRTCWKASATACSLGNDAGLVNPPSNVLDADLMTRFATGAKMITSKTFNFDVDMGKAVMINGISTNTLTATDIPPQIEVDVSTDGVAWTPVACGTNSAMADISFTAVSARYVRLVQHGIADAWWSMVDLQVYRSGADDTCGAGATTTACTSTGMAFPDTCCGASNKL
jgi:hypothetical protein